MADAAEYSAGATYGVVPDFDALILAVNGGASDAINAAMAQAWRGTAPGNRPAAYLTQFAEAYLDYAAAKQPR